jgi:adenosylcobinamide kinase/adenosylcobinamide-phosphate guanylyltransferase
VVVDCLTLWLANLLDGADALPPGAGAELLPAFARERAALLALIPGLPGRVIFVANEVGFGLVPETPWGGFSGTKRAASIKRSQPCVAKSLWWPPACR